MTQMPEPTRFNEPVWLQPYPDVLLEGVTDEAPGPEARCAGRARRSNRACPPPERERAPLPNSKLERDVVGRFAETVENGDIDGMVALLTDDAWLTMPPLPHAYQGRPKAPETDVARAFSLFVLTLEDDEIAAITWFADSSILPRFGLPRILK